MKNFDSKDIVLNVKNLGKKYRLNSPKSSHSSSISKFSTFFKSPFDYLIQQFTKPDETEVLWALRNINLSITRGEVVGVIGANGSGKSTFLKLLSRVTEPTTGHATVKGRLAALLEVGTGMHPELTGMENIFLNGTILGMKKEEIKTKLDEIISFSGIEKFLQTPVKRYSSGMRVRLGFAIAAHLEPDILIVDEVLAVGDINFQNKCLNKMEDVSKTGKTVLFVSHNMASIETLCSRAVLLNQGQLKYDGKVRDVISKYTSQAIELGKIAIEDRKDRRGNGNGRFVDISFLNEYGETVEELVSGKYYEILINYNCSTNVIVKDIDLHITFFTMNGKFMFNLSNKRSGFEFDVNGDEIKLKVILKSCQ